jgi:hypothetical protein
MNLIRFEHINLSCHDLDRTKQFYQTIFPDWYVRVEGTSIGAIPLIGDLFDAFYKSNIRNLAFLEQHLEVEEPELIEVSESEVKTSPNVTSMTAPT